MIYALGFSLEGREIKTALVSKQGKKLAVEYVHAFTLDEEGIDPFKLLGPIVNGKKLKIVSGLPAADVILRDLKLPMVNPRKILAVLPFQAETLIPFPPDETLLHPHIWKKNRKTSRIFLAATKKEKLSSHLEALHSLHIDPDQVSTSLHALARWIRWTYPPSIPSSYLKVAYIGRSESFFLLMENEHILSAKVFSFSASSSLEREIKKADEFIQAKFPEVQDAHWLFAGNVTQEILSKYPPILAPEEPFITQRPFALAIGLALDALASDDRSVQWRQGFFSSPHLRKSQRTLSLVAAVAFLFTAGLLGPLGHSICKSYEKNLLQRAHACLDIFPPEKKGHPQDLDSACLVLHKRMNELKKEEKLGTFAPKVAELLAWLSTCISPEEDDAHVSFTSLNYLLDASGKVGIRLTIQAPPPLAEKFHKKLLREDALVDRNCDFVWKKEKASSYSAQFYLK